MKKFLVLFWLLLPLVALGAADKFIHQLPDRGTPAGTDVFPIDVEDPPGTWKNYKLLVRDLSQTLGTTTVNNYTTNYVIYGPEYYTNNTFVSNYFNTNILVDVNVANYFETNFFTYNYSTNLTITNYVKNDTYVSNYVTEVISTNTYVSNYFNTNIFVTEQVFVTNNIGGDFIATTDGFGTNTFIKGLGGSIGEANSGGELPISTFYYGTTIGPIDFIMDMGWVFLRQPFAWGGNGRYLNNLNGTNIFGWLTNNTKGSAATIYGYVWPGSPAVPGVLTNNGSGTLSWVPVATLIENTTVTNLSITTNFVDYNYTTNLYVNQMRVNNSYTTNLFYLNASPQDVAWSGPTNFISYTNGALRSYATVTPCSITSLVDEIASHGNPVLLCLTNAEATNVNIYLPTTYKIASGNANPIVLTNGNIAEIWFYSAGGRKTVISQQFY